MRSTCDFLDGESTTCGTANTHCGRPHFTLNVERNPIDCGSDLPLDAVADFSRSSLPRRTFAARRTTRADARSTTRSCAFINVALVAACSKLQSPFRQKGPTFTIIGDCSLRRLLESSQRVSFATSHRESESILRIFCEYRSHFDFRTSATRRQRLLPAEIPVHRSADR
jgi:hypothetical protein